MLLLLLLLLLMPFRGQCMADSLTGLDLGIRVRSRRWAGTGSSSRLPCYLDSLGAGNGGRVGKNDLVYGRGVGCVLLGIGTDYDDTLRLLLRLLVGRSYRGYWPT